MIPAALLFVIALGGYGLYREFDAIDRSLTDYAEPYDSRRLRLRHIGKRVFIAATIALAVWSAHTLVLSIVHLNESRVVQQEHAARSQQ